MSTVIFVGFNTEQKARAGEWVLRELHSEGAITLYNLAIVLREPNGKVVVRERPKVRPIRTAGGLIAGGLVGLLGGPAAAAFGLAAGALAGASFDLTRLRVDEDFVNDVGAHLERGDAAVVAEIDEDCEGPLDRRMDAIGGTVLRRTRRQIDDGYFEQLIDASQDELARLEAEQLANVRACQDEAARRETDRLQAKIDAAQRRMRAREKALEAQLQLVRDEGAEKIALLEAQKATVTEESRALLERRLADVRADYEDRMRRLNEAQERRETAAAAEAQ